MGEHAPRPLPHPLSPSPKGAASSVAIHSYTVKNLTLWQQIDLRALKTGVQSGLKYIANGAQQSRNLSQKAALSIVFNLLSLTIAKWLRMQRFRRALSFEQRSLKCTSCGKNTGPALPWLLGKRLIQRSVWACVVSRRNSSWTAKDVQFEDTWRVVQRYWTCYAWISMKQKSSKIDAHCSTEYAPLNSQWEWWRIKKPTSLLFTYNLECSVRPKATSWKMKRGAPRSVCGVLVSY